MRISMVKIGRRGGDVVNFQTIHILEKRWSQYGPAGKHTVKPITSSSNEAPDIVHVNEENLKSECVITHMQNVH